MKSVDEMIMALQSEGWRVDPIHFYGPGDWRAAADKKFPSGHRKFCEGCGISVHEALQNLCRDCLGEGWEQPTRKGMR